MKRSIRSTETRGSGTGDGASRPDVADASGNDRAPRSRIHADSVSSGRSLFGDLLTSHPSCRVLENGSRNGLADESTFDPTAAITDDRWRRMISRIGLLSQDSNGDNGDTQCRNPTGRDDRVTTGLLRRYGKRAVPVRVAPVLPVRLPRSAQSRMVDAVSSAGCISTGPRL